MRRPRLLLGRLPLTCDPRAPALGGLFILALTSFAWPRPASAHDGVPPAPHDLWSAWTIDPLVLTGLLLAALGYAIGTVRLSQRGHAGRLLPRARIAAYWLGLVVGTAALVSPIAALGTALFAAHMAQHLLLVLIAPPLLLLGRPVIVWLWAFDRSRRRSIGHWWRSGRLPRLIRRAPGSALFAWGLHVGVLWIWHLPALYQAALTNEAIHAVEHLSFGATAVAFWWAALPVMGRPRLGHGAAVIFLFAAAMQSTALGVLMTFSATPWYPAYGATAPAWGLSPLADQQLAGLIMWIPAAVAYAAVAVGLAIDWLGEDDRRPVAAAGTRQALSPPLFHGEKE